MLANQLHRMRQEGNMEVFLGVSILHNRAHPLMLAFAIRSGMYRCSYPIFSRFLFCICSSLIYMQDHMFKATCHFRSCKIAFRNFLTAFVILPSLGGFKWTERVGTFQLPSGFSRKRRRVSRTWAQYSQQPERLTGKCVCVCVCMQVKTVCFKMYTWLHAYENMWPSN